MEYGGSDRGRFEAIADRLRERLGRGALMCRQTGMDCQEGTFPVCAFWTVHVLVRLDEAETLMDELVSLGNDVGLYSEEMDAGSEEMVGSFPHGLSHPALINAAAAHAEAGAGRGTKNGSSTSRRYR